MKFTMIVTYRDDKIEYFKRFLKSLKNQVFKPRLICIYQGSDLFIKHKELIKSYVEDNFILLQTEKCSLSKARNQGLKYLYDNYDNHEDEFILFPDDDCWYEDNFLNNVSKLDWNNVGFYTLRVFDPYQSKVFGKRPKDVEVNLNYLNSFRLPISVGLVIKFNIFKKNIEYFNESLGVGTSIGSGEETEAVLKLLHNNCKGKYNGFIDVYHEIYTIDSSFILKYEKYAIGQGYCIKDFSKRFSPLIWLVFLELQARSFAGYILSTADTSLMYKIRFKSILKGVFYDKSSFR